MYYLEGSDAEVWARFKNGDDEAFSFIYSDNAQKLYRYGLKFTTRYSVVEDSIQELFLELIKNRKSIGHTDNILRYLLKSFRRKLFRQLKKETRYSLKSSGEEYAFEILYSVEQEIIDEEHSNLRVQLLSNAVKDLSSRQKEAIYLKFTVGLEYGEISEIMEMNLESCRNLMYRAVKALKETIENQVR